MPNMKTQLKDSKKKIDWKNMKFAASPASKHWLEPKRESSSYTQKELKQISKTFELIYKKHGYYPSNYQKYLIGWKNRDGSFSYGTYDEGNEQVTIQGQALWNFPIIENL